MYQLKSLCSLGEMLYILVIGIKEVCRWVLMAEEDRVGM